MEQRTCNIIMCCKGNCKLKGATGEALHDIALYMSKECGCPIEVYTHRLLGALVEDALFDFIGGAVNPGFELRQMLRCFVPVGIDADLTWRICQMFALTQVQSGCVYINGFDSKLIKQSEEDLFEPEKAGEPDG